VSRPKQFLIRRHVTFELGDLAILSYYMLKQRKSISETLRLILRKMAGSDEFFDADDFRKFALSREMKEEVGKDDPDLLEIYPERINTLVAELKSKKQSR
jgi:hypothetical protein